MSPFSGPSVCMEIGGIKLDPVSYAHFLKVVLQRGDPRLHSYSTAWRSGTVSFKGKFATRHCYFLTFVKTHCLIVTLPSTITILCHICQNTLHCPKKEKFHHFLRMTIP
jgi:hypothetical protein